MAVNRNKLKALPDEKIAELVNSNEMELIYLHLYSMRNFSAMLALGADELSKEKGTIKV